MDKDGQAKDGVARPGCQCKACDVTNTRNEFEGYASQAMQLEGFATPAKDYRNWETMIADWEMEQAEIHDLNL